MSKFTISTIFSGIGGVEFGAKWLGVRPIWSVERDPKVSCLHMANHDSFHRTASVEDVNPNELDRPDILWASPPCQSFSRGRDASLPEHESHDAGLSVVPYIRILKPDAFVLENVPGYIWKESPLYQIIDVLQEMQYFVWYGVLDASDLGVAQNRKRLILIASRNLVRPVYKSLRIGWWDVIKPSHLYRTDMSDAISAVFQRQRLPDNALIDTQYSCRDTDSPRKVTVRTPDKPSFTICRSHHKRSVYVRRGGTTFKLLPEGFAALQSFDDSLVLPHSRQLAVACIGDAVPPKMVERVLECVI